MANDNEPAKLLLPYLQRADELQKHEPLVAYYCRLYAMERGLKIPATERTKTTNSILISLMKQLEKDKKSLKLGPDDNLHLEGFALNVFAKADKQDRAGRADLSTAKTFYAASIFFEILNQFGVPQADLEQKQKYAIWKAADIRKALKEGRKPVAGPPGGDDEEDLSVQSSTPSGEYDLKRSSTDPGITPAPESDSPSYDKVNMQHPTTFSPPSNMQHPTTFSPPSNMQHPTTFSPPSVPPPSNIPPPLNMPSSPSDGPTSPSYPTDDYPANNNYHQPPPTNTSENPTYSQSYHHQPPYQQEPQHHLPQHYPSHDQSHSYPNFQSYPSFTESSLPAAQSPYPTYYQGSDGSYPTSLPTNVVNYQSTTSYSPGGSNGGAPEVAPSANYQSSAPEVAPPSMNYQSSAPYSSGGGHGGVAEAVPPSSAQKYQYDSNYQPPPEKIAEAHKAARFAVGALAFDDVSIGVDFLIKALELLTNPSAGQ